MNYFTFGICSVPLHNLLLDAVEDIATRAYRSKGFLHGLVLVYRVVESPAHGEAAPSELLLVIFDGDEGVPDVGVQLFGGCLVKVLDLEL